MRFAIVDDMGYLLFDKTPLITAINMRETHPAYPLVVGDSVVSGGVELLGHLRYLLLSNEGPQTHAVRLLLLQHALQLLLRGGGGREGCVGTASSATPHPPVHRPVTLSLPAPFPRRC